MRICKLLFLKNGIRTPPWRLLASALVSFVVGIFLFYSYGYAEETKPNCISDSADWVFVAENDNQVYYSNVRKIDYPSKGIVKTWVKIVSKGERVIWDDLLAKWLVVGQGISKETLSYFEVGEMLAVFEIKYPERMFRLVSTIHYNKKRVSLRSLEFREGKWQKIPSDPHFKAFYNRVLP